VEKYYKTLFEKYRILISAPSARPFGRSSSSFLLDYSTVTLQPNSRRHCAVHRSIHRVMFNNKVTPKDAFKSSSIK